MRDAPFLSYVLRPDRIPAVPEGNRRDWIAPAFITAFALLIVNALSPVAANWMAIVLFLLGVPHGAVERTTDRPRFIMPTLSYSALYLVFGILVFCSWLLSPLGTFICFLLLSAWHFGTSEPDVRSIGLWVIIGSCLVYPSQTLEIFALLWGGGEASVTTRKAVQILAFAALLAVMIEYVLRRAKGQAPSLLRVSFLIAIFIILPPIPAVAVYFFALHGLGEFTRTLASVSKAGSDLGPLDILKLYGPATFPAMIGAVVIIALTLQGYVPMVMAAGLGVAFIIPHMLPVEDLLRVERQSTKASSSPDPQS